jgi:HD-GYP domain-containing protein (c-di-GMP phosphodiesterase class II)
MVKVSSGNNRILDLIPRDRLVRYLRSTLKGRDVRLMVLDPEGAEVVAVMPDAGVEGDRSGQLMSVPIHFKEELLGFLASCRKADGPDDGDALAVLSLSASHLEALAEAGNEVESLSAEVVRVYEELSLIYGLTGKLGAKVDVEEICKVVADEVERVLNPADIMVQLADETRGVFRTVYSKGAHSSETASFTPGLEEGLIGRAFISHKSVLITDAQKDRRHTAWPFTITNLLAMPLLADGKVLGVITATDKQDGREFDSREEKLVSAISSVAAIAIKNSHLYLEIKDLLEGFINASVTAVESRDPTTSGHSTRVALMTVELAKKVDASDQAVFKDVSFTREQLLEMQYAGLLHDFGKIGVQESVLLKEAKLEPHQLEIIKGRFDYIKEHKIKESLERKLKAALEGGRESYLNSEGAIDSALAGELAMLERYLKLIEMSNDPRVLLTDLPELASLDEVADSYYPDAAGVMRPYLTPFEFKDLHVLKGSLNAEQRREIEQHVTHSYNFLSKIPWTNNFAHLAEIVYAHHEKLDGRGYPRGLAAQQIPLQAKMMTVADIFDALTAWDRPYKKSVSVQKALFILEMEASEGKVEPHLVQIFRDAKVYKTALEKRTRR